MPQQQKRMKWIYSERVIVKDFIICSPSPYSVTDNDAVKSQPGISELVKETLKNTDRSDDSEDDPPLDLPRFHQGNLTQLLWLLKFQ